MRTFVVAVMLFGCLGTLTAQQAQEQVARATHSVVVRSGLPVFRHIGSMQTRYVVPSTAVAVASARTQPVLHRIPSLRFLQLRH